MTDIVVTPIGVIHSPFATAAGVPIQPRAAIGVAGQVVVFPEFSEGLDDLAGFSHVYLLYHFHLAGKSQLKVVPFLDSEPRGVFATRAPSRPNRIGLSIVRLRELCGNTLLVENVDIVDGTPLVDIKPYVPAFDHWDAESIGWLSRRSTSLPAARADGRFEPR
jgi:tRNA-Thr(GGU) m(6)t(6)A37 methyltransferase TsaA